MVKNLPANERALGLIPDPRRSRCRGAIEQCSRTTVCFTSTDFQLMNIYCVWAWVLVAQLCPTLCKPMDCSPPGFSVHRIPQARKLGWVAIPFSRGSCQPRDWTWVSCTAGKFFTIWTIKEAPTVHVKVKMLVTQGRPALCDPMDCKLLDSSVHEILQARIVERFAILFSSGSSPPKDWTRVSPL